MVVTLKMEHQDGTAFCKHILCGQLRTFFRFRHLKYVCSFTFASRETPWPSILQQADGQQSVSRSSKLSQSSIRTCAYSKMPAASYLPSSRKVCQSHPGSVKTRRGPVLPALALATQPLLLHKHHVYLRALCWSHLVLAMCWPMGIPKCTGNYKTMTPCTGRAATGVVPCRTRWLAPHT